MVCLRWKWWQRLSSRLSSSVSPSEIYPPSLLEGHVKFGTVSTLGMMLALQLQRDANNRKTPYAIKSICVQYLAGMSSRAVDAIHELHPAGIDVEVGGMSMSVAASGVVDKFDQLVDNDGSCATLVRTQWALLIQEGLYGISCTVPTCQAVKLPSAQIVRLPGLQIARLPDCQIARLPDFHIAKRPDCQVPRLPDC